MSARSTPPMLLLYTMTMRGLSTTTYDFFSFDHLLRLLIGSSPMKDDTSNIALSCHSTMAVPLITLYFTSYAPCPVFDGSLSLLRVHPQRRLRLMVATVRILFFFSSIMSSGKVNQLSKKHLQISSFRTSDTRRTTTSPATPSPPSLVTVPVPVYTPKSSTSPGSKDHDSPFSRLVLDILFLSNPSFEGDHLLINRVVSSSSTFKQLARTFSSTGCTLNNGPYRGSPFCLTLVLSSI